MKENVWVKVIGIILAVAMLITLVTSNIASITSISLLKSGAGSAIYGGTVVPNTTAPAGGSPATPAGPAAPGTTAAQGASPVVTGSAGTNQTTAASGGNNATTAASGGNDATTAAQGSNDPAQPDYAQILANYTMVLDKAKADKPGFSKKEFQSIPESERNITEGKTLASILLGVAGNFMKTEDQAEIQTKDLGGNMKWYPINEHSTKGCLLTDTSKIKFASQETLADGNVKIVITLHDDLDPEPYKPGPGDSPNDTGSIAKGFCGTMFSPLSRADIDKTIVEDEKVNKVVKDAVYSLNYHDCTATLVYNPSNNRIVTLDQHMVVLITASAKVTAFKMALTQELHNQLSTWDYIYE